MFKRLDLKQRQTNNIAMITFWSQFAVYTLNTVLILVLTRPLTKFGLAYSEAKGYLFIGVANAMGYLVPMVGGFMADKVIGTRRAILLGSILLAIAYLLVMLSGLTLPKYGDALFIAAYALIPAMNSLLMPTASAMVSRIFSDDNVRAKSGMTIYYMSINVGGLLAAIIAPQLMETKYGPLSIFAVVFVGKALSAMNFAWRYPLYNNVIEQKDTQKMRWDETLKLIAYLAVIYVITLTAYHHTYLSSYIIGTGCAIGIGWYFISTLKLSGDTKTKQLFATLLIVEAIVFFVIYNQMNTTLVLFAQNNSNLNLLGLTVSPANYQLINPLCIIVMSFLLPAFYKKFHQFSIPYQFAAGIALSGVGLLVMWFACLMAHQGLINGNYLVLTYVLITIAELWVSAIGLSMIGLYCDHQMINFSMGAWYLSSSLSNILSGLLARFVALPEEGLQPIMSLPIYQKYYLTMGGAALLISVAMLFIAIMGHCYFKKRELAFV